METANIPRNCPKCGHARRPGDGGSPDACPSCGIVYAKFEARRTDAEPASRIRSVAAHSLDEYVDEERRRLAQLVYALYLLPTGITTMIGFSIARTSDTDYKDEIAYAHNEWQTETISKMRYVFLAALVLFLLAGGAWLSHLLVNDAGLVSFSQRTGKMLLVVLAGLYLWIAARSIQGWLKLLRDEGP